MSYVPVVDISKHQGHVDFRLMRSRNVAGVIIRAAHATVVDTRLNEYTRDALAAGYTTRDLGFYTFVNPSRATAVAHAITIRDAVAVALGTADTFFMLDVEDYETNDLGKLPALRGPAFAAWLRTLVVALEGYGIPRRRIVFYSNAAYWNPHVGDSSFGEHGIIVARYPTTTTPPADASQWASWVLGKFGTTRPPGVPRGWATWDGWQFSAGGNRAGVIYGASSGDLDLNIVRADAWTAWTSPTMPPASPAPPITSIAALAAATSGGDMQQVVADKSKPAAPERWVTNGIVRVVGNEHTIDWLTRSKKLAPNSDGTANTIRTPEFLTPAELAGLPLVKVED